MTKFFNIDMIDIYGNPLTSSATTTDTEVLILAEYDNHAAWGSPIGVSDLTNWDYIYGRDIAGLAVDSNNGKFKGQITVFRAGTYILHVKVNGINIIGSPLSYLLVEPSDIYGPNCIVDSLSSSMTAGSSSVFSI